MYKLRKCHEAKCHSQTLAISHPSRNEEESYTKCLDSSKELGLQRVWVVFRYDILTYVLH